MQEEDRVGLLCGRNGRSSSNWGPGVGAGRDWRQGDRTSPLPRPGPVTTTRNRAGGGRAMRGDGVGCSQTMRLAVGERETERSG